MEQCGWKSRRLIVLRKWKLEFEIGVEFFGVSFLVAFGRGRIGRVMIGENSPV